jgi:hypothetical protein
MGPIGIARNLLPFVAPAVLLAAAGSVFAPGFVDFLGPFRAAGTAAVKRYAHLEDDHLEAAFGERHIAYRDSVRELIPIPKRRSSRARAFVSFLIFCAASGVAAVVVYVAAIRPVAATYGAARTPNGRPRTGSTNSCRNQSGVSRRRSRSTRLRQRSGDGSFRSGLQPPPRGPRAPRAADPGLCRTVRRARARSCIPKAAPVRS